YDISAEHRDRTCCRVGSRPGATRPSLAPVVVLAVPLPPAAQPGGAHDGVGGHVVGCRAARPRLGCRLPDHGRMGGWHRLRLPTHPPSRTGRRCLPDPVIEALTETTSTRTPPPWTLIAPCSSTLTWGRG